MVEQRPERQQMSGLFPAKAEIALNCRFSSVLLQIQGRLTRVFPGMMSRSRKAGAIAFWPA